MVVPQRRSLLLLLLLAVAIVLPPYFGIYYTRFATQIAIYGMAALSIDLLLGYTGLITFGQAALFGVGAYAAGMLTVYGLTNAFVVWPLAVLISMLFALAIGSPAPGSTDNSGPIMMPAKAANMALSANTSV